MLANHLRPRPVKQPIPTVGQLASEFSGRPTTDFQQHLVNKLSSGDYEAIWNLSQGSVQWLNQRLGRVTASLVHQVMHFSGKNPDGSLVCSILQGTRITNNKAIEYGHLNEARARDLYVDHHNSKHESVKVTTTGLHVDPTLPFLAASPDGLVSCAECGEGLLEIKCSFKYRDAEPRQIAASVKDYHLSLSDSGDFQLKTTSAWYSQIQCQLGVCQETVVWLCFVYWSRYRCMSCETWSESVGKD